MKAALVCHGDESWTESLPAVLLGIRSAWKDDLKATSAELLYGESLRLPGEFLDPQRQVSDDVESYVARLRRHFVELRPIPASRHGSKRTFVFKDIVTTSHVFVRRDAQKGSLQPAYDGPYEVLRKYPRHYVIRIRQRSVPVSLDRLKPAYLCGEDPAEQPLRPVHPAIGTDTPPDAPVTRADAPTDVPAAGTDERRTRSGRRVRFPDHFVAGG